MGSEGRKGPQAGLRTIRRRDPTEGRGFLGEGSLSELEHNLLRHETSRGSPRRVDFLDVHCDLTNTEINVSALQPPG